MLKKPELLAPAGTLEKMKMAVLYGADAVYLAGKSFGLRALGGNFTREELAAAVEFTHARGKKVYVTINIFPHNSDLVALPDYLKYLQEINVDALLVADLGVFMLCKKIIPDMELHISTQANNTNWATVNAWQELGAKRVVLAREMSLAEIREIRAKCTADLEMFIHGAMCISYSGRCLLSNYFTGRDSNRGTCAQSCRWKYALVEETRPGKYFPIEEDERGTYIMNSKDMCLMPNLRDVIESGVDSLKIEGRMKSVHYAASVTKAYRLAIDSYFADPDNFAIKQEWTDELEKVSHRAYTTGFYYHQPDSDDQIYGKTSYDQTSDFVGLVREYDAATGYALVEQRNNMKVGQEIEVFQPTLPLYRQTITDMIDDSGEHVTVAPHPQQLVRMRMEQPVEPYTILRRDIV